MKQQTIVNAYTQITPVNFKDHHFLILADAKSKWLEVKVIRNALTMDTTIHLLQEMLVFTDFPT